MTQSVKAQTLWPRAIEPMSSLTPLISNRNFRFSGHETFPCRYTWLPKAVLGIRKNPRVFSEESDAMVALGVGKNMVRAIRFWADAAEVAVPGTKDNGLAITEFGRAVFGPRGHDEFLEDIRTLWLIHWKFSTNVVQPLFAWHFLLNFWHRPDFTRSEILNALTIEARRGGKDLSPVTLENHFTTFLHTYIPTRGKKGVVLEDNLDCPLVELELLQEVGERAHADTNRRESIYAFRIEEKPEISPELFIYCLNDFWRKYHQNEKTLSFREVAVGEGSPGQVFKLPETDIRERLEVIEKHSHGVFVYQESAAIQQVIQQHPGPPNLLLNHIYRPEN